MKKITYLAIGLMTLLFMQACQDKQAKNYNKFLIDAPGLLFIRSGIEGCLTEIKASGLVATNSRNKLVLNFAKMMTDDLSKASSQLKNIGTGKFVDEKDSITVAHQQLISDLKNKTGPDFDKTYMQMIIADHESAIKVFADASQNADPDVSKFANKTLPLIKRHLDAANAILSSLK